MTSVDQQHMLSGISKDISDFIEEVGGSQSLSPLKSVEVQKEERTEIIKKGLERFQQRISLGVSFLTERGIFPKKDLGGTTISAIAEEVVKEEEPSKTLQERLLISNEEMVRAYECAAALYEAQHYEESGNIFTALIVLNSGIRSFWIGLGLSEEKLGNPQSAGMAYLMAMQTDFDDLTPGIYSARCFFEAKEDEMAKNILRYVIETAGQDKKHEAVKIEAERMLY